MSGGRANFAAEVLSEKQKVFQWMRKWLRENDNGLEDTNVASFDLPDLIILLQCAGFTLHKFQNEDELFYTNPTAIIGDTLKIELYCSKSGMKAEMLKSVQSCSCPKNDNIITEEFFSVTSCAPASKGSFDVSLSSFLPTITHPKQNVVGDIFKELIAIIKNENQTSEADTNDVRRTIERMSIDPTKSLMQNLKDIKRVVDSFLGDKEEEDGRSVLRKSMEERLKTPDKTEVKAFPETVVEEKTVSGVSKTKTKPNVSAKKPITGLKLGSTTPKTALASSGNKNKVVGGVRKETGAVKKNPLTAASASKTRTEKTATVGGKNLNALSGNASVNKFGRVSRTKAEASD